MDFEMDIEKKLEAGMVTLADIRRWVSTAKDRTSFCDRTNETIYPAAWSYGRGAGDATTSTHYDHRLLLAANRVASLLGVDIEYEFLGVSRSRDAAAVIAAALRAQHQADAREDTHANEPISVVRGQKGI